MRKKPVKVTESMKQHIYQLAKLGVTDAEIAKTLGVSVVTAAKYSTFYWADVMNKKKV